MLKIFQARLQWFNCELPDVQADLEKAEEPENKLPTSAASQKKQWNSRETRASLTIPKPLTMWITTNCGKFLKRWAHEVILPVFWWTCTQVKKQQLELAVEQWTGSKLGKECIKAVCHPAYLTSWLSTSCEMPGWKNHKLESRLPGSSEIRYADDTNLMAESEEELKSLFMKVKEESEKAGLTLNM